MRTRSKGEASVLFSIPPLLLSIDHTHYAASLALRKGLRGRREPPLLAVRLELAVEEANRQLDDLLSVCSQTQKLLVHPGRSGVIFRAGDVSRDYPEASPVLASEPVHAVLRV